MQFRFWSLILFLGSLFACRTIDDPFWVRRFELGQRQVFLQQVTDSAWHLISLNQSGDSSIWPLDYPVYQFWIADLDKNGQEDILVGVIKATRFFPRKGRRLFVFRHVEGEIRPMWLGSRLGMPLQNFYIDQEEGISYIIAIEREGENRYTVARYQWMRFGFEFVRYEYRNQTVSQLKQLGYEI